MTSSKNTETGAAREKSGSTAHPNSQKRAPGEAPRDKPVEEEADKDVKNAD
jgi:hypothetical protein